MITVKILWILGLSVLLTHAYEECYYHCICADSKIDCRWSNVSYVANISFPPTSSVLNIHKPIMKVLKNYSFSRLPLLKKIEMRRGAIAEIEPKAFEGLSGLRFLQLSGNLISTLPKGFGLNLRQLEVLSFANNKLTSLDPEVFEGMDNLQTLDVSNNNLRYLTADVFRLLPKLKQLFASNNSISHIEWNTFKGLNQIQDIRLDRNKISQLSSATFNNLPYLHRVSIRYNNITNIHEQTFLDNPSLVDIRIAGNPFHCDCNLRGFRVFMHNTSDMISWGSHHPEPTCTSPIQQSGRTLVSIPSEEFRCPTTTTTTTTTTSTTRPPLILGDPKKVASDAPKKREDGEMLGLIIAIALGGMLVLVLMTLFLISIAKRRYRRQKNNKFAARVDAVREAFQSMEGSGKDTPTSVQVPPSDRGFTPNTTERGLLSQSSFFPNGGLHVEVKSHSPSTSETQSTQLGSGGSPQINGHVDIVPAFQQNGSSGKKVKLETLV